MRKIGDWLFAKEFLGQSRRAPEALVVRQALRAGGGRKIMSKGKIVREKKEEEGSNKLELADILREYLPGYLSKYGVTFHQWKVLKAIEKCRTKEMGYHLRECEKCGHQEWRYNSCKNRHCPKCQWGEQYEWVKKRMEELPGAKYHHTVFTVPDGELYALMIMNKEVMYEMIIKAAAETLKAFGEDPKHLGAKIGMIGVLHTWGQTLNYHVHVHFLVPAGGLTKDGERWKRSKYGDKFLFPIRAMSKVFRGKFIAKLKKAYKEEELVLEGKLEEIATPAEFGKYLNRLARHTFRVHSKPATKDAKQVVKYLGGYMRRVAISNSRLEEMGGGKVVFKYKDNRDKGKEKRCRMEGEEFIRRFVEHIIPEGFVRVRYYGIFAGSRRKQNLAKARKLIGGLEEKEAGDREQDKEPRCPVCGEGKMVVVEYIRQPVSIVWLLVLTMTMKYEDTS